MAFRSIDEFINKLEQLEELVRIKYPVSTVYEITEIVDRMSKQKDGGKAILFENNGTEFPLLINAFGSENRIKIALGLNHLDDVSMQLNELLIKATHADTFWAKLSLLPTLKELTSFLPRTVNVKAKCQQVISHSPNLSTLPILKCWPADGGRFITLPAVHTKDPETGMRNVGMYRMQIFDEKTTGMHWHKHKTGATHYEKYKKAGTRMPIAVTLGGDPSYIYAATAPMPENMDEYLLAGFLRKKKVELVKCITNDIEVPVDVDFVIEGYVDPKEELIWEGPFGDHTGFYSLADWYPKFHVTCITHRRGAIYPATIVGIPPQEDAWIGKATERIFLMPIKMAIAPEVVDLDLPTAGVAHNIAIVSIHKTFDGQAAKVMNALWGAGQMMFNKIMIVVDSETSVTNYIELLRIFTENIDLNEDLHFVKGPTDVLDHSSSKFAVGSKIGIDLTSKKTNSTIVDKSMSSLDFNGYIEPFTEKIITSNGTLFDLGISIGIIAVDKKEKGFVRNLSSEMFQRDFKKKPTVLVFVDSETKVEDLYSVTWLVSGNIDPKRDCFILNNNDATSTQLVIDGTRKSMKNDNFERDWPNLVVSNLATIEKIDHIWAQLNIGEFIPSPSLKYHSFIHNEGAVFDWDNESRK